MFLPSRFAQTRQTPFALSWGRLILLALSSGGVAACGANDGLLTSPQMDRAAAEQQTTRVRTIDEDFLDLATATAPGFAGFVLAKDGHVVVMMTDASEAAEVLQALRASTTLGEFARTRPVTVHRVAYDYPTLTKWYRDMEPLLDLPGVEMSDIDEAANRIWIGVRAELTSRVDLLTAGLKQLGVPPAAVAIETVPATEFRQCVQDPWTMTAGGIKIHTIGISPCTLGFAAIKSGLQGFITASHCTPTTFGYDGSLFYQPMAVTGADVWGIENTDPVVWQCAGVYASKCRYSDAAFIWFWYPPGVTFETGHIVRTMYPAVGGRGSKDVDPANPYWNIVAKHGTVPVGLALNKVGQISGWTIGTVTQTCVDFPSAKLRCQTKTTLWSESGDSGSPVFYAQGPVYNPILHGIIWGGPVGNYGISYHSMLSGIELEIGSLQVCVPSAGC